MNKLYFVYILTNYTNNVLYTGVTNNIIARVYFHRSGLGSEFTSKYHLTKLVYYEMFESIEFAIKREKAIKNLVRRKKIDLINKFNSEWEDLYPKIIH
ncbi:MAG: GIY-YIG nuclease family protein [bacterium]|nr:GIY-YIG nuclease family protein [bacterium]